MSAPVHESVDERMAELLALLLERGEAAAAITEAEAMEFCRNAYMRGYMDGQREPEMKARRRERVG